MRNLSFNFRGFTVCLYCSIEEKIKIIPYLAITASTLALLSELPKNFNSIFLYLS